MDTSQTNAHAAILRVGDGFTFGPAHKTRECAERGVSPFEGAEILGFAELFPAPIMGMHFALQRHANETIAELRELERRGVRIQANRGTIDEPRWETLTEPAQFTCPAHLYRAHPDDLAASIPDEDPDEDSLVDGEGFEAIEVLQALAQKLGVPCTHAAIEDAIDDLVRDRHTASVSTLLGAWEARSREALPADAMLINRHIRELREAIATSANDEGQQRTPDLFVAWLEREMPAGTVIGSPTWWAPKLARALRNAERGVLGGCNG